MLEEIFYNCIYTLLIISIFIVSCCISIVFTGLIYNCLKGFFN